MLGNAVFRLFAESPEHSVVGTLRTSRLKALFPEYLRSSLLCGVDVENPDALMGAFADTKPDVIINCIGLVKQLLEAGNPLSAIPINSLLPHRLAHLSKLCNARLVHISTDCVFSGSKGMYTELDVSDARDLYGRSKFLGEVDYPNAITLRTSIIGHELEGTCSLINWFLSQEGIVKGFKNAVFSGLPSIELARIIRDIVIPRPELHGLYHVSAEPINKFDLLSLVADVYGKKIEILPDEHLVINRSLDSTRFRQATGLHSMPWVDLIKSMYQFG